MDCLLPSCKKNLHVPGSKRKTILWRCNKCSLQVLPAYSAPAIKSHIAAGPDDAKELKDFSYGSDDVVVEVLASEEAEQEQEPEVLAVKKSQLWIEEDYEASSEEFEEPEEEDDSSEKESEQPEDENLGVGGSENKPSGISLHRKRLSKCTLLK